ncbi:MAG: hypothetical protein E7536_09180 [Ruminococcaceae bacterium]|nr:hypothetical protein [Oscillospiraceae bacterium]
MKQTMKWILINEQEDYVVFRCSVCNSEITVKYGEELPYCKHCESEPDGEQIAKKMTDNEIIKAFEYCVKHEDTCEGCPCVENKTECVTNHPKHALDLINRQKEEITKNEKIIEAANNLIDIQKSEIEALIAGQETLQKYIAEKDAEIEKLNAYISRCESGEEYWVKCLLERPAEAVKEFAERLKKEWNLKTEYANNIVFADDIDNAVKEMVGDAE